VTHRLWSGQVLVAGGLSRASLALTSAELYNPTTGQWSTTDSMSAARQGHTATLLPNGQVLVAGGVNAKNTPLASAELYTPSSGTWTKTGAMHTARQDQSATLLPNGQVLVAGGFNGSGNLTAAELFNPETGKWSATGNMNNARANQGSALLKSGKVLVVGGDGSLTSTAELYDPATGQWSTTGAPGARVAFSTTLLNTGNVLVAGGQVGHYPNVGTTSSAELYDPSTGTWAATGSMTTSRMFQTAALLQDGQVLVAGGEQEVNDQLVNLTSAERYLP
jgi:N-acetylneuraminic acid mutarotase